MADVAERLERFGGLLVHQEDLLVRESPGSGLWFELRAALPSARASGRAIAVVRELWRTAPPNLLERREYEYELLDHDRDFRRAWHLHDHDFFVDRYRVVVHEHCESPIGSIACDHYAGEPVRDAFAGVELLLDAWVDPNPPDCRALTCLELDR